MSVEFRAIEEGEREECLDLWCTVWPGENSRAYFRRYFYGDVEWLPYYTQVAVLDGKLVSAVQICKRVVACGDCRLTMGGIANVATLPEYRGQGYNTECLKRAIAVMEADAMDFSLLFTGIHDYYARLGFETLTRRQISGTIRVGFTPDPSGYAVRPATEEDLPYIQRIYEEYNAQRPIAVQRYDAYWRDWIGIHPGRIPETLLVAVNPKGEVCGYLQTGIFKSAVPYSADEKGLRLIEFGAFSRRPGEEAEVTQALLEAAAERMASAGTRKMRLDIALEGAVLDALDSILEDRQEHLANSGMARLTNPNLLPLLRNMLRENWSGKGCPIGEVTFATPDGPYRLLGQQSTTGEASLTGDFVENASSLLPCAALFGMVFGSVKTETVTEDAAQRKLIDALSPADAFVYWGADGF